jgi:putative peptide maturation dehydrogenase
VFRRSPYAFLYLEDGDSSQPHTARARMVGIAVLTGARYELSDDEIDLLRSLSARRWSECDPEGVSIAETLVEKGLVVSDLDDERNAALRRRDEDLMATQWNGYAALFHYMTRWRGVAFDESAESASTLKTRSRAAARAVVEVHGWPPSEFAEFGPGPVVELPRIDRYGGFYDALRSRRTTRSFDASTAMTLEQLDTVVRYVFGCHAYGRNSADAVCIKRTSPSGGGLAPIEAYLIIDGVESVPTGIYHYNGRDHSLVQMENLSPGEGRAMATKFMCGQWYFGGAHVTFVLTARFYRNYWKYRRHPKAYSTILMDAAHLTQTLYLVSAHEGLGAFVTIAINDRDIEERLGLDGVNEGVIAMAGCGPATAEPSPLDMGFDA